jgi:hypothetical protein
VKFRDQIERETARQLIEVAASYGYQLLPVGVVIGQNFKIERPMTLVEARRALGVSDRVFEVELGHYMTVQWILGGDRSPGGSKRSPTKSGPR